MEFTYDSYANLIKLLKEKNYNFADYHNYKQFNKCVILRHDIDYDLEKALPMAELENTLGVKSTYFVLVTSDFYNVMSKSSQAILDSIQSMGHKIGLHFDEKRYEVDNNKWDREWIKICINSEAEVLSKLSIGRAITSVSMHRPSKQTLESNLNLDGMANSYSQEFFKCFKYLSDSRMNWREDPKTVINSGEFDRIQLLTHPFWYSDEPRTMKEIIKEFISGDVVIEKRYSNFSNNFSMLKDVISKDEICIKKRNFR